MIPVQAAVLTFLWWFVYRNEDAATPVTLCQNTNKQAARSVTKGSKYSWTDVGVSEFYKYIFYMDYWRQTSIFSVAFPATVMSRDRYRTISWNVHMSGPGQ